MWWLALSMSSAATALAIWGCGSNRKDVKRAPESKKSGKSARSLKKGRSSKIGKSSTSEGSRKSSKSGKNGKKKSLKSSKSGRKSSKSSKSGELVKSFKSAKLAKSGKLAKSEKSSKSSKSGMKSAKSSKKALVATKKPTVEKPVVSKSAESAESVSKSQEPTSQTPRSAQIVELRAEPQEMSFQSIGGLQTFKFINESNERRAFKVKCSDNQLYRVAPVFGFIEPKSSTKIDVLRQNGSAKVDKLVLITAPADDSTKLPKEILAAASAGNSQMTVIPLLVEA